MPDFAAFLVICGFLAIMVGILVHEGGISFSVFAIIGGLFILSGVILAIHLHQFGPILLG